MTFFTCLNRYTKQARYQPSIGNTAPSGSAAAGTGGGNNYGMSSYSYNSGPSKNAPIFGGSTAQTNFNQGAGNSVSSTSGYGAYPTDSNNAVASGGVSSHYGGSKYGDASKNQQSRFSRLAQFGMGTGAGTGADGSAPKGYDTSASSGYGTNNSSSLMGAGAYGRHKF